MALLRPADPFQIPERFFVAALFGLLQHKLVAEPLVLRPVDELAHADVGGHVLRVLPAQQRTEDRAPRVSDDIDRVFAEALLQPRDELVRVLHAAVDAHVPGLQLRAPAQARAALVPADHGHGLRERGLVPQHPVSVAHAGAAVQEQQHGQRGVGRADAHRLRDPSDGQRAFFVNGILHGFSLLFGFCHSACNSLSIAFSAVCWLIRPSLA